MASVDFLVVGEDICYLVKGVAASEVGLAPYYFKLCLVEH